MKTIALLALLALGCGGAVTDDDAGSPPAPACTQTEYGCSFCVPNATPGVCGNIGRYLDDGGVEYGCCVGATPYCSAGTCVQTL